MTEQRLVALLALKGVRAVACQRGWRMRSQGFEQAKWLARKVLEGAGFDLEVRPTDGSTHYVAVNVYRQSRVDERQGRWQQVVVTADGYDYHYNISWPKHHTPQLWLYYVRNRRHGVSLPPGAIL